MAPIRVLAAALLLILAAVAAGAAESRPARVLFIGNSLTYTGDIPTRFANLARAMGHPVEVESVSFPAFSLTDHWVDGRALSAIRRGGWDLVVLQQGTSAHEEGRTELVEYARRFAPEIRKVGARPALYMAWPLSDRPGDFPDAIVSYRLAAKAVDGLLLPVGEAWLRVLSKSKRTKLYTDAIHPSSIGGDLCVLTIYLSIFPAGPQEFTEEYVRKVARSLDMREDTVDPFFDAATRAIDEPLNVR
jgi:hypothetical protein